MAEIGNSRRRVKLYMLNEERQWDDRGTGYVTYAYVEKLKGMSLLVRLETDGSLLLESKILPDTAYQKQQETLIVWSEAENYDLALSFQEKSGCDEIWEKICQVQGKDPSVDVTQEVPEDPESSTGEDPTNVSGDDLPDEPAIELPPCEMSRLDEIADIMTTCFPLPIRRERLATAIENENYIKKLMDLFHMCEDLDNIDGLHNLYDIFKNIFLLNKAALYDILLCDDVIMDIVGVFEYDPQQTKHVKHRDYLRDASRFKEVVEFTNPDLIQKIHQTYRVQYIQDVILPTPSVFEENMLSCLNSFIFFNKVEIVTAIQEDDNFLKKLFEQLVSEDTDPVRRRQLVLFLKEFCTFSQTLQIQPREAFFKTLSNLEILPALKVIFGVDDEVMKAAAIDIFSFIIEYSPSMVRGFILQEGVTQDDEDLLINLVVDQMVSDKDPELGGAVQLMGILRLLLDPENMVAANNANKTEKTEFLSFFYKHSMHALTAPLFAITANDRPSKDDFQSAQLLSLILELLTFCVEHHAYHMKNYILNKDLLRRVLVLMKSSHAFLTLCGLRFMRRILSLKDEFYNRYIVKGNLFLPVVRAFVDNGDKYNLLNSAIIEMFEFIKSEDIKTLCSHVVDEYFTAFETVDYVKTFKDLKLRHDQQLDRLQSDRTPYETITVTPLLRNNRFRRDPRSLDDEEEIWFDQDDDVDSEDALLPLPPNDVSKGADLVDCSPDHDPLTKFMGATKRVREPTTDLRDSPPKLITRNSSPISINLKTSPTSNAPQTPPSGGNSPKTIGPSNQNGALHRLTKDSVPLPGLNKPLKGLVDYPDEDSDEEQENNAPADAISPPAAKRPRLSC